MDYLEKHYTFLTPEEVISYIRGEREDDSKPYVALSNVFLALGTLFHSRIGNGKRDGVTSIYRLQRRDQPGKYGVNLPDHKKFFLQVPLQETAFPAAFIMEKFFPEGSASS